VSGGALNSTHSLTRLHVTFRSTSVGDLDNKPVAHHKAKTVKFYFHRRLSGYPIHVDLFLVHFNFNFETDI